MCVWMWMWMSLIFEFHTHKWIERDFDMIWNDNTHSLFTLIFTFVMWCWYICVCCVNRKLPPHPNVVQVFGVSLDGHQPVIVMEYCTGGTHTEREKEREHTTERESVCYFFTFNTHTHILFDISLSISDNLSLKHTQQISHTHTFTLWISLVFTHSLKKRERNVFFSLNMRYVCI
jgi:hypothetical protein